MARAQYNYAAISAGARNLRQTHYNLDNKLTEMRNMIGNMVSGEFKTTAASGTLNDSYTQFTTRATKTLQTLNKTAQYLDSIVNQQKQLDGNLNTDFGRLR